MDSILNTVKKQLGIVSEYDAFDDSIIIGINTAISTLSQLGVTALDGYQIDDDSNEWSEIEHLVVSSTLPMIKQYLYLKTRRVFDTPTSGTANQALEETLRELEFRIKINEDV